MSSNLISYVYTSPIQGSDRDPIQLLCSLQSFHDYIESVLLDERTFLNNVDVTSFFCIFFPRVSIIRSENMFSLAGAEKLLISGDKIVHTWNFRSKVSRFQLTTISTCTCITDFGRYSRKVTKLETANFSHPFYETPLCTIFITFELL